MNLRIKLGLAQKRDGEIEDFGFSIIKALTNNPDFLNLTTTLDELITATNALSTAMAATTTGERVSFMLKNQRRDELETVIKKMANYVTLSGDPVKIVRAGFTIAADNRGSKDIGTAGVLKVQVGGHVGEAVLQVGIVKNALSYFVEYSVSPAQNDQWVHVVAEKGKLTLSTLKSLTAYDFRGGAVGSRGQYVYTEVITKTVL